MAKDARKKVNFMVSVEILKDLEELVPAGKRSDFVNEALEDALITFSREIACEEMDKLRERMNLKLSTEEIIKLKNYGRA